MGFGKSFKRAFKGISKGALKTMQFWKPKRVREGIYQQWNATSADPLGKELARNMRRFGLAGKYNSKVPEVVNSSSAVSYRRLSDLYGGN